MDNIFVNTLLNNTILDVKLTGTDQMNKFRENWVNLNWDDGKSGKEPGVYFIFDMSDVSLQSPLYIGSASSDTWVIRDRVGQYGNKSSGSTFRIKYVERNNLTEEEWDFKKILSLNIFPIAA